ncbi:hypothetical protein BOX15_Mlig022199g1 [Macrostomum lignano]|uniref:EGF-like domain-containing protein n=1 Tax=Macrostomum lignano TaxID=282301 RepID=A0A267FC14_9PLAT|nr:hypothetical protein BOX15_Mlig022199g1 [Macrostomum lignano]
MLNIGSSVGILTIVLRVCLLICPSDAANCSTVICHNGGTCNNYTENPPCLCPLPYIAPNCESAADYCFTLQPDKNITELPVCLNGGNCTLTYTDPYFNCTCPSGTSGIRCYNETDASSPVTTDSSTTTSSSSTSTILAPETTTITNTNTLTSTISSTTTESSTTRNSLTNPTNVSAAGIAGITVGAIAFIGLLILTIYLVYRRPKRLTKVFPCCNPKICPTAQQQLAESGPDFGRTLKSDGSLDGGLSPGPSQQNDSYQHSNPQFA